MNELVDELTIALGEDAVLSSPSETLVYECDGYVVEKSSPDCVVFPQSTDDVVAVVKACNRHGLPFVPRGAGTSLAGGTLAAGGGVMISMTRMTEILEVRPDDRVAIVEPGVVNVHLTQHLKGTGLHFAPDPSSQGACTIGGNVATNSGGPHTLKHGVTTNHVLGVEVVLPNGEVAEFGGPCGADGYDLTGLFVGSEGTFGVCTKIWVLLSPDLPAVETLLVLFDSVEDCTKAISAIIAAGVVPAACEMIDQGILNALEDAFEFGFPRDAAAALIIECDGLPGQVADEAERASDICRKHGARSVRRAEDEKQRRDLWKCRKQAFGAIGRLSPSYCTQDGVVPRTKLPEILRFTLATAEKFDLRILNVYHAGDGNIHPILLFDERDPDQCQRVIKAGEAILRECLRLGGSVSGEHGIGVEKIDLMHELFSETDLEVMRNVRDVFNPDGLCSPHKLLPTAGSCTGEPQGRIKPGRRAAV